MTRAALGVLGLCAGIGLGACTQAGNGVGQEALASQPWILETIDGKVVTATGHNNTVTIETDGNVHGRAGCASFSGRAEFDGNPRDVPESGYGAIGLRRRHIDGGHTVPGDAEVFRSLEPAGSISVAVPGRLDRTLAAPAAAGGAGRYASGGSARPIRGGTNPIVLFKRIDGVHQMSSLKDRRSARRPVTPRITQVRIDVSDSNGTRKSVVWSGLNLPKFRVEGMSLLTMGQAPRRPGKKP